MILKDYEWQIFIKCIGITIPNKKINTTTINVYKKDSFIEIIYKWLLKNHIFKYNSSFYPKKCPLPKPTDISWIGKPN